MPLRKSILDKDFKKVDKKEFDRFLKNYPKPVELYRHPYWHEVIKDQASQEIIGLSYYFFLNSDSSEFYIARALINPKHPKASL